MSLSAVISRHPACQGVAKFLDTADLSRLQGLSGAAKAALEDDRTWLESVSAALPRFRLRRELFGASSRGQFLALLRTFADVAVVEGCEVPIETMDDARRMAKLLGNAQRAIADHRARGGRVAHAVIGSLSFDGSVDAAFEAAMSAETDLCLGTPIAFPTPLGAPSGVAPLRLHFAWQGGSLLVSARDDDVPPTAIEMPEDYPVYQGILDDEPSSQGPLTLDLITLSRALTLNHRGVALNKNSAWRAANTGIFAATRGEEAARRALADGVLCILCLRDDAPEHSMHLVKTLHLDKPKR